MSIPPEQQPPYRPPVDPVDPDTAPLRPVRDYDAPRAYATDPYVADRAPVAATFWTLESLRTALALVGLIAVAALGLAIWALLRPDNDRRVVHSTPATTASITALTTRLNHLEATVHSLSSSTGAKTATTQSLVTQINALQHTERRLSAQVASAVNASQHSQLSGHVTALSGELSQLSGRVSGLSSQVSQLKARAATQTTTTVTSTAP